jgi:hypothetical protein
MIRPENIRLETVAITDSPSGDSVLAGVVSKLVDSGAFVQLSIDCGGDFELRASMGKREYNQHRLQCGDRVHLAISADHIHVLED